jgi:hypothetical protein
MASTLLRSRAGQLAQRGRSLRAAARAWRSGWPGRIQAVDTGSRLSAKLDAELARLGDFFFGAAAGVFGLGLGAQELVGQVGALGLEFGQLGLQALQFVEALAAMAASISSGRAAGAWCWFSGWSDIWIRAISWKKCRVRWGRQAFQAVDCPLDSRAREGRKHKCTDAVWL